MKKALVGVTLFVLGLASVQGRLGASRQELIDRFGAEISEGDKDGADAKFVHDEVTVFVWFVDGRAFRIRYVRPTAFFRNDVEMLLRVNVSGVAVWAPECEFTYPKHTWRPGVDSCKWVRSDGRAEGHVSAGVVEVWLKGVSGQPVTVAPKYLKGF
jgi:hypothetical protein